MEARGFLRLILVLLVLAGGCAAPTEAQRGRAQFARQQLALALNSFSAAIRDDDVSRAMALLSPDVPPADRSGLKRALEQAVWLRRYTGYQIDADKAVSRIGRRSLRTGAVEIRVEATSEEGKGFVDRYAAIRKDGAWFVAGFVLQEPVEGERLDPPEGEADGIRAIVDDIFESLKGGRPAEVYVALPRDDPSAHTRVGRRFFWSKLFGVRPKSYKILNDLYSFHEFQVLAWPDPQEDLPLLYVAGGLVVTVYEIPYAWPAGGVVGGDTLSTYLFFSRSAGRWRFQRIRLVGEGTPGSR